MAKKLAITILLLILPAASVSFVFVSATTCAQLQGDPISQHHHHSVSTDTVTAQKNSSVVSAATVSSTSLCSSSSSHNDDTMASTISSSIPKWFQHEISITAPSRGCHLITSEVNKAIREDIANIQIGMANLFIQHTSASLTINENADPDVRR